MSEQPLDDIEDEFYGKMTDAEIKHYENHTGTKLNAYMVEITTPTGKHGIRVLAANGVEAIQTTLEITFEKDDEIECSVKARKL